MIYIGNNNSWLSKRGRECHVRSPKSCCIAEFLGLVSESRKVWAKTLCKEEQRQYPPARSLCRCATDDFANFGTACRPMIQSNEKEMRLVS